VLISPGELGGMGLSFKDLDESDIDDMVYLFQRHQEATQKAKDAQEEE